MSDLTVREMTAKEAEAAVKGFVLSWGDARSKLLEMFERSAHKALGYPSFIDFAQDRLGIRYGDTTIKENLAAARVERNLSAIDSTKSTPSVPLKAALELNRLSDEQQREAWKEVSTLKSYGTTLPKDIARAIRDIVARRLNKSATPAPPSPAPVVIEPVAITKPRVPIKPIVPPTYDRGPEFDDEPIAEEVAEAVPVITETPEPPAVPIVTRQPVTSIPAPVNPALDTVSRIQYEALFCITKAFAGAVDRADKDAAIEARVDFKNFLKEWGP